MILETVEWVSFVAGVVLVGDALSGLAHWLEDTYFSAETPLLGRTISRNILHHLQPRAFVGNPWHVTIRSSVVAAMVFSSLLSVLGLLGPFSISSIAVATLGNLIHKWAHTPSSDLPAVVLWAQRIGLFQSASHHALHHAGGKDTHYCVLTNMANPILDWVGVWRLIEVCLVGVAGVHKRPDSSLYAV